MQPEESLSLFDSDSSFSMWKKTKSEKTGNVTKQYETNTHTVYDLFVKM